MPRKVKTPGRRKHGSGWQTFIKGNPGEKNPTKSWPMDTDPAVMDEWIEKQKALRDGRKAVDASAGFAADVATYLAKPEVRILASVRPRGKSGKPGKRVVSLNWWLARLGRDRARHSITVDEIKIALYELLASGNDGQPMKRGSVRAYKIALSAFFTAMDPDGFNPCFRVKLKTEPKAAPRGQRMDVVTRILDAMIDRHRGAVSLSKIRARVMAFTGLPPALIREIGPTDLQPRPDAPTHVRVSPRHKGAGADGRTLKLTPPARQALADFHAANAYGDFTSAGLWQSFTLAASKLGYVGIRPYDLRHSFCTNLYRATEDLNLVAFNAVHAPGSHLTIEYARAAEADVAEAGIDRFGVWMAAEAARTAAVVAGTNAEKPATPDAAPVAEVQAEVQAEVPKLPRKVARPRNYRVRRHLRAA